MGQVKVSVTDKELHRLKVKYSAASTNTEKVVIKNFRIQDNKLYEK